MERFLGLRLAIALLSSVFPFSKIVAYDFPLDANRFLESLPDWERGHFVELFSKFGLRREDDRRTQALKLLRPFKTLPTSKEIRIYADPLRYLANEFPAGELLSFGLTDWTERAWATIRTASEEPPRELVAAQGDAIDLLTVLTPADEKGRAELARVIIPSRMDSNYLTLLRALGANLLDDSILTEILQLITSSPSEVDLIVGHQRRFISRSERDPFSLNQVSPHLKASIATILSPIITSAPPPGAQLQLHLALFHAGEFELDDERVAGQAIHLLLTSSKPHRKFGSSAVRYLQKIAPVSKSVLNQIRRAPFSNYYLEGSDGRYQFTINDIFANSARREPRHLSYLIERLFSPFSYEAVRANDLISKLVREKGRDFFGEENARAIKRALERPLTQELILKGEGKYAALIRSAGGLVPLVHTFNEEVPDDIIFEPEAVNSLFPLNQPIPIRLVSYVLARMGRTSVPPDASSVLTAQREAVLSLIERLTEEGEIHDPALFLYIANSVRALGIVSNKVDAFLRTAPRAFPRLHFYPGTHDSDPSYSDIVGDALKSSELALQRAPISTARNCGDEIKEKWKEIISKTKARQ
jgi:hypothetical protein